MTDDQTKINEAHDRGANIGIFLGVCSAMLVLFVFDYLDFGGYPDLQRYREWAIKNPDKITAEELLHIDSGFLEFSKSQRSEP